MSGTDCLCPTRALRNVHYRLRAPCPILFDLVREPGTNLLGFATRLDLSFNEIEKIEGLETLTKLTDLSLYNNFIKELKVGLDTLRSYASCAGSLH
eukprot:1808765-Rhodomonas_salina.1